MIKQHESVFSTFSVKETCNLLLEDKYAVRQSKLENAWVYLFTELEQLIQATLGPVVEGNTI